MNSQQAQNAGTSRRAFVKITGAVVFVAVTGGCNTSTTDSDQATTRAPAPTNTPGPGGGQTTQRPAVLAIGPAGENLSRVACLVHDASNAAGQGGFGAVFGSKNLKAISVIGTGHVEIRDPKALLEARLWQKENYAFDLGNLRETWGSFQFQSPPAPIVLWAKGRPRVDQRPQACMGCRSGCRARYKDAAGNEASCIATAFYGDAESLDVQRAASDLLNRYGFNAVEML
jgi:aldehyde:ferredoxin oxidoreductase